MVGSANGRHALLAALPEVDVLVNSFGIFEPKRFEDIPPTLAASGGVDAATIGHELFATTRLSPSRQCPSTRGVPA